MAILRLCCQLNLAYTSTMKLLKQYALLVLLLILGIVLVVGFKFITNTQNGKYTFTSNSQTVIKELRALHRLETASFTIEKVIDAGTNGNQFQQFLFGDRILLIAHGEVIAGFDLAKLDEKAISVEGTTLRMTLPPPQILSSALDTNETRVYDRRQGLLSQGDKDLESAARTEAETIITKAACTGGILTEASKNGRSQLTTLFKALGFQTVIIEIPSASC